MLLFRSEEHLDRWLGQRGAARGGVLTLEQIWDLADTWYRDKLSPGWRRRPPEEAQAVFGSLGLSGPFWQLRDE